ncbi:Putative ribonuclease H protein At1g65750 [Linum perenne]
MEEIMSPNLGICTIMRAELRAAALGLEAAWELGARKVMLQVDSQASVRAIMEDHAEDSRHGHTLHHIRQLLSRNWRVEVTHIYRERNRVADLLAHFGHSLSFGSHFNFPVSYENERAIASDTIGVCFPRLILFFFGRKAGVGHPYSLIGIKQGKQVPLVSQEIALSISEETTKLK